MTTIYFADGSYFRYYCDEEHLPSEGEYYLNPNQRNWNMKNCLHGCVQCVVDGEIKNIDLRSLPRKEGYSKFNEMCTKVEGFFINGILDGFGTELLNDLPYKDTVYKNGIPIGRQKYYSSFLGNKYVEQDDTLFFECNEGNNNKFCVENKITKSSINIEITELYHIERIKCYNNLLMSNCFDAHFGFVDMKHLNLLVRSIYRDGTIAIMNNSYFVDGTKTS